MSLCVFRWEEDAFMNSCKKEISLEGRKPDVLYKFCSKFKCASFSLRENLKVQLCHSNVNHPVSIPAQHHSYIAFIEPIQKVSYGTPSRVKMALHMALAKLIPLNAIVTLS